MFSSPASTPNSAGANRGTTHSRAPHEVTTIESLVRGWQAGDVIAAEELVMLCRKDVERFFRRMVPSEAVDDLVQDTLIACFESSTRFRAEASFRSYVLGVARNQLFTHVRNRQRRRRDHRLDKTWVELCLSSADEADEKVPDLLAHALSRLPERLRTPIEHFYFLGRSRPEIAASLKVPEGTVASRIRLGRSHLREMMEASLSVHARQSGIALFTVQAESG